MFCRQEIFQSHSCLFSLTVELSFFTERKIRIKEPTRISHLDVEDTKFYERSGTIIIYPFIWDRIWSFINATDISKSNIYPSILFRCIYPTNECHLFLHPPTLHFYFIYLGLANTRCIVILLHCNNHITWFLSANIITMAKFCFTVINTSMWYTSYIYTN